jgi:nucleotide-binding universal stress UspA family protein
MITLKRILVPTDLSEHSLAALEYAVSFGLLYNARLFLLFVADLPLVPPVRSHRPDPETERRPATSEHLQALRSLMDEHVPPALPCTPVVRAGVPAEEIRRFALEEHADLVVMATHGRTGLRHIVMGSVAEMVVRLSAVPVLTIKPSTLRESVIRHEDIENELHLR